MPLYLNYLPVQYFWMKLPAPDDPENPKKESPNIRTSAVVYALTAFIAAASSVAIKRAGVEAPAWPAAKASA